MESYLVDLNIFSQNSGGHLDYQIIENVLSGDLLLEIHQAIKAGPFDNGKKTADGPSKQAKNNLQLTHEVHGILLDKIAQAVMTQPLVQAYAVPSQSARPIINRYETGMEYALHVDSAYMGAMRTDLSYTLFLDDADSYDGGELVMATQPQQIAFKLPANSMVLYPTGAMHRVSQITRGTRHAIVGWIQSQVRDTRQRRLITQLAAVKNVLGQNIDNQPLFVQTNECVQELMRMWAE